jgi:hypothetical protein
MIENKSLSLSLLSNEIFEDQLHVSPMGLLPQPTGQLSRINFESK